MGLSSAVQAKTGCSLNDRGSMERHIRSGGAISTAHNPALMLIGSCDNEASRNVAHRRHKSGDAQQCAD